MALTTSQVEDLRSITSRIVESAVTVQHLLIHHGADSIALSEHLSILNGSTALLEDLTHEASGCVLLFGHPNECMKGADQ